MRPHFRFEDLEIWQLARSLAVKLHKLADELDKRRLYRYAEQLRAAGLSLTNNIAEGSGSTHAQETRARKLIGWPARSRRSLIWLMSELSELYQAVILDHNKKPLNFHKLETANRKAEGYNPLCGDHLNVYVQVEDDQVKDVSFEGSGCAISKASASMMTQAVKGKSKQETEELFDEFHRMVTERLNVETEPNHLGQLTIFAGVRDFPVRVKCATLPWHTLHAALNEQAKVSTE